MKDMDRNDCLNFNIKTVERALSERIRIGVLLFNKKK